MITAMLMESRVNLRDSQNISGASQPNSVASILRNNWSRWGLVLERKNLKMKQLVQRNPCLKKPRDSNLSQNECLWVRRGCMRLNPWLNVHTFVILSTSSLGSQGTQRPGLCQTGCSEASCFFPSFLSYSFYVWKQVPIYIFSAPAFCWEAPESIGISK